MSVSIAHTHTNALSEAGTISLCTALALHDGVNSLLSGQGRVQPEGPVLQVGVSGRLLSAARSTPHQADLLLQPSGQGLGPWVRSLPFARIRYSQMLHPSLLP